jgi:hypothetical protein
MPSKWLTWSPKTASSENIEPLEPTKLRMQPTSVGFGSASTGTLPKVEGEPRVFPHCPRCASYALYRKNNLSNYECQTCGLRDITEDIARRVV